jgi:hypothetical protein
MTRRRILGLCALFLVLPTGAPIDCREIHDPRQCMRIHTCGWSDICFRTPEQYVRAYQAGRVVHCRPNDEKDASDLPQRVRLIPMARQ